MSRWIVEFTDEFGAWFGSLDDREQNRLVASVQRLEAYGPQLDYPHTSAIAGSRHSTMRELRVQIDGRPFRVFYAFNPLRAAILLIGGDKTGDGRFYEKMIPVADDLFDDHLQELRKEGLL
ncbi:MAG: type II toxin-antitoxin system RelE/ParE family toxin [Parvularculaceae bacterium]|nr:type II toxin-antitoxin system RelE/ParE family toxin [Parvularculaceae bacterium]